MNPLKSPPTPLVSNPPLGSLTTILSLKASALAALQEAQAAGLDDHQDTDWGFPKIRGPHNKDYSISRSILCSPDFGKLQNLLSGVPKAECGCPSIEPNIFESSVQGLTSWLASEASEFGDITRERGTMVNSAGLISIAQ